MARISDLERGPTVSGRAGDDFRTRGDQLLREQKARSDAFSDRKTVEQLRDIMNPQKARDRLPTADAKGPIPARKGIGVKADGAGIASPLVEPDYLARTYYEEQSVKSSDGLFEWKFTPVKDVFMVDANGEGVQLTFAEPVQPPPEEEEP